MSLPGSWSHLMAVQLLSLSHSGVERSGSVSKKSCAALSSPAFCEGRPSWCGMPSQGRGAVSEAGWSEASLRPRDVSVSLRERLYPVDLGIAPGDGHACAEWASNEMNFKLTCGRGKCLGKIENISLKYRWC